MYDLPWWVMGVMCLAVTGMMVLLVILVIARAVKRPRRGSVQEDFDDQPRRRPRRLDRD